MCASLIIIFSNHQNGVEIISRLLRALEKEPVKKNAVNVLLATRELESFASNYTKIYFKANESRVIYKEHFGRSQKKMVAWEGPVSQRTSLLKQPNIKAKDRSYEKIMPIRPYHQPEYYSLLRFLLGYLQASLDSYVIYIRTDHNKKNCVTYSYRGEGKGQGVTNNTKKYKQEQQLVNDEQSTAIAAKPSMWHQPLDSHARYRLICELFSGHL